jgi:hypothetical protein
VEGMPPTDPRDLVRLIHRVTAGSLVAAAVGAGVVTVHLAGHHARKLASAASVGVAATGPTGGSTGARTPAGTSATTAASRAATRRAATASRRPTTAKRTFRSVAPVQPSVQQPQATSSGS